MEEETGSFALGLWEKEKGKSVDHTKKKKVKINLIGGKEIPQKSEKALVGVHVIREISRREE